MRYSLYLDGTPAGPWMGHLLAEPGCIWLAPTPEDAVARAPEAIAGFFGWLRRHGEPGIAVPDPAGIAVTVAEQQAAENFGQSGGAVGLFAPDRAPLTDADIACAVRRLGYARRDLLEAVAELPAEALDWEPAGGKRTIRKNLHHVRNAQGWYLTRVLGEEAVAQLLPEPWPEETFPGMNWVLERCVAALLDLPAGYRSGIFRAERPTEDWTPRKMLRRFVEHEWEHVEVVRRTIAARMGGGPVRCPWEP